MSQQVNARFSARMSDANDPTRGELERIVAVARG
jgi:hypothetical protein